MTVRKAQRRGKPRLIIDIGYIDRRTGRKDRYRHDAEVQTMTAARAEDRRRLAQLELLGFIPKGPESAVAPASASAGPEAIAAPASASVGPEAAAAPASAPSGPKAGAATTFTFGGAVELFRETKAIVELKRTTRRGYEGSFAAHLLPRFKNEPLESIDFEKMTKLDAALVKAGLSPSSRGNVQIALRSVLRCAVEAGRLGAMPKLPELPKVGRKVIRPPRAEDINLVLSTAYPAAFLALLLAADAGLRAGEIRGLRWMDIDLGLNMLVVRQTIYSGEVDTPKSGHEREVPLSARLATALAREKAAKKPKPTDPAAPSSRGTVWGEYSLLQAFRRTLTKAELPAARLHDLRHYFVTRCFQAGVGAPTVQALAGHIHLSVTQRYAHTDEGSKREAIGRLDRLSLAS